MAQRTVILLEDDSDGDKAAYLRDVLAPFVLAARPGGRPASTVQEPRRPGRADRTGVR